MHPAIEIVEAEDEADRRLLEALADWCDRYTPLVALDGDDGLFLDITGCSHLFGGERAMLDDVLARFFHQGFEARGALASTPGAAWAGARFGGNRPIVPAGEETGLIASLPLAALRLDAPVCAGLESVGLRVAGALLSAPRAPLARRFGRTVALRLDQALGHVEEPVSPRLPIPMLMVERHFFEPIGLLEDIEALVMIMARQLKSDLERRGQGAERLQLQLFRVDGAVTRVNVAASRPLRDPQLIYRLFRERLTASANLDAGFGFDLVRLAVLSAAHFEEEQAGLDAAAISIDGDVALFADRVRMRLGERAVTRPVMVESHLPERAAPMAAFAGWRRPAASASRAVDRRPVSSRPIRLFDRPESIEITAAEIPEGAPSHFRWRHVSYRVAAAEGPERIAPEWWRMTMPHVDEVDPEKRKKAEQEAIAAQTAGATRDYFRVEDEAGRRYWLYRQGYYGNPGAAPRWFMHGLFA